VGGVAGNSGPTACRSCGAPVWWVLSTTGKRLPLDAEPSPAGTVMVHGGGEEEAAPVGEVLTGDRLTRARAMVERGDLALYVSHFATCPHADDWRRR